MEIKIKIQEILGKKFNLIFNLKKIDLLQDKKLMTNLSILKYRINRK
jgi:hypothetical protein